MFMALEGWESIEVDGRAALRNSNPIRPTQTCYGTSHRGKTGEAIKLWSLEWRYIHLWLRACQLDTGNVLENMVYIIMLYFIQIQRLQSGLSHEMGTRRLVINRPVDNTIILMYLIILLRVGITAEWFDPVQSSTTQHMPFNYFPSLSCTCLL